MAIYSKETMEWVNNDGTKISPSTTGQTSLPDKQSWNRSTSVEIFREFNRATELWGPFNSMHEAYGIIVEELEEFWDHVKVNQKRRDLPAMRTELVQLAAMAVKAIATIDAGRGRV